MRPETYLLLSKIIFAVGFLVTLFIFYATWNLQTRIYSPSEGQIILFILEVIFFVIELIFVMIVSVLLAMKKKIGYSLALTGTIILSCGLVALDGYVNYPYLVHNSLTMQMIIFTLLTLIILLGPIVLATILLRKAKSLFYARGEDRTLKATKA